MGWFKKLGKSFSKLGKTIGKGWTQLGKNVTEVGKMVMPIAGQLLQSTALGGTINKGLQLLTGQTLSQTLNTAAGLGSGPPLEEPAPSPTLAPSSGYGSLPMGGPGYSGTYAVPQYGAAPARPAARGYGQPLGAPSPGPAMMPGRRLYPNMGQQGPAPQYVPAGAVRYSGGMAYGMAPQATAYLGAQGGGMSWGRW